jgi:hypothetical protein
MMNWSTRVLNGVKGAIKAVNERGLPVSSNSITPLPGPTITNTLTPGLQQAYQNIYNQGGMLGAQNQWVYPNFPYPYVNPPTPVQLFTFTDTNFTNKIRITFERKNSKLRRCDLWVKLEWALSNDPALEEGENGNSYFVIRDVNLKAPPDWLLGLEVCAKIPAGDGKQLLIALEDLTEEIKEFLREKTPYLQNHLKPKENADVNEDRTGS